MEVNKLTKTAQVLVSDIAKFTSGNFTGQSAAFESVSHTTATPKRPVNCMALMNLLILPD